LLKDKNILYLSQDKVEKETMETILYKKVNKEIIKNSIIDLLAVALIYFIPTFSHLFALPIYYIEPMRLMVIIAIAHTSKKNALILAATLPIFSFVFSTHPIFLKTLLITGELILMVFVYYFFSKKINNNLVSILLGIGLSKIAYYNVKYLLIVSVLINGDLISTPIYIQFAMMIIFSTYIFFVNRSNKLN
jgi:hypothetical protein